MGVGAEGSSSSRESAAPPLFEGRAAREKRRRPCGRFTRRRETRRSQDETGRAQEKSERKSQERQSRRCCCCCDCHFGTEGRRRRLQRMRRELPSDIFSQALRLGEKTSRHTGGANDKRSNDASLCAVQTLSFKAGSRHASAVCPLGRAATLSVETSGNSKIFQK